MKLRNLHEETGTQVGEYLVQYLNDRGIKVSKFIPQSIRGVIRVIESDDAWVSISVFNNGQIIAVATEHTLITAGEEHEGRGWLATDYHEPDSFQKVEAFIRKHLACEA